ncbi:hypothetical protein K4F52_007145 [Lecanicillium sp. MT-2017a]|nr:hypothetical protein K4F52_007145 [Lecanicillium sp. MT-2017a]
MKFLSLSCIIGAVYALPGKPTDTSVVPSGQDAPDIEAIMSVPQGNFTSYKVGGLRREGAVKHKGQVKALADTDWRCSTQPILTWGDNDDGGRGITITNAGDDWRGFYIYHNSCDSVPWKYIWIEAGKTQFVSFPERFEGRIQRGVDQYMLDGQPQPLGSWFEISWDKDNIGWGDVSLIRGCDGGILTWSLDGIDKWKGFTQWILDGAPYGAYDMKNDGQWVIKATEGENAVINTIPRDWDLEKVGAEYVYVDDSHGSPVISSNNGRFGTYWPEGRA